MTETTSSPPLLGRLRTALTRYGFLRVATMVVGRALYSLSPPRRFRGVFGSYHEAIASVRFGLHAGYNNDDVVDICFEEMCKILPGDARVLTWLDCVLSQVKCILDAGGHMGTKYRAFRDPLYLDNKVAWIVWDTPAAVRAGRRRARADGLSALSFVDTVAEAPPVDLMLCSGLLQYLDIPFPDLIRQLVTKPRHLILNKVATRDGPTVVLLERIGNAEVPYQIRDREEFIHTLIALGYDIVDEWVLPELSHVIEDNPQLGASVSRGYYARLTSI